MWPFNRKPEPVAEFAEPRPPKVRYGETGLASISIVDGIVSGEYQEDLANVTDRMEVYRGMRSDGTVAALERITSLPIRTARWHIESDVRGQKRAVQFMSDNLFGGMSNTWEDVIQHVMLSTIYGFVPFEKVWEERDGLIGLRKLAPRDPATTYRWHFDETGGLAGWEQEGYRVNNNTGMTAKAVLPVDKMLLFSYDSEFGNPEGRSILRPAYRHWYYKDKLYTLAAIRCERQACGTPMGSWEQWATETVEGITSLNDTVRRLRTHETGGATLPRGAKIDNFSLGPADVPFLDFIEHQDVKILQCALAQFLNLGQGENTGAFALSRDQSSIFMIVLNSLANWVASVFNSYLIPQWYQYNWGPAKVYPKLKHGQIAARDQEKFAGIVATLFDPTLNIGRLPEIEDAVREEFDLPPRSPGQVTEIPQVVPSAQQAEPKKKEATKEVDDEDD